VIICLLSLPGSMLALDGLLLLYQILNDCFFAEQKALWCAYGVLQAQHMYMLPQHYIHNALDIEGQQRAHKQQIGHGLTTAGCKVSRQS